ncbi:MAG: DUF1275 domain-containing protein [Clostridia bacterium]|nr:DUF1275 domain-containing protein [Clostridia bacterium]
MDNIKQKQENDNFLLECERWWIFALMMCTAGFYGGYTFTSRGGVFCNAQTANFVLFGLSVGNADWKNALYYLVPMISYLSGTIISEFLPAKVNKNNRVRWDTVFVGFEMLVVLILGFIPESAPVQICHIMINFTCAMQYNTFRAAEKIPMSTVFCSAHTRSVGVYFTKWLKHRNESKYLKMCLFHAGMIGVFILGAIFATVACRFVGTKAIWFAEILLAITFADLLHADLTKEKGMLNRVPKGH